MRYINNKLSTLINLVKWRISSSSDCSLCLSPETLLHIVAGCKSYLDQDRFTWRHDSVLKFIAKSLTSVNGKLYSDLPKYLYPSIITGEKFRLDLLFISLQIISTFLNLLLTVIPTFPQVHSKRKQNIKSGFGTTE